MQLQDPQKLAEKLLEAANSKASAASKIALAWFLALVLLWLGSLEPVVPKLNSLYDKTRKADQAASQIKEFTQSKYGGDEDQRAKWVQELKGKARSAEEARKEQLRKAKVPFSVPGFPNFDVPIRFASVVWNMLLLGLLVYLVHARTTMLQLIGRAARLLRDHDGAGILRRPAVALFVPWWVAPLPKRNGLYVTAGEFRNLIGWGSNAWPNTLIVICVLFVICVLQLRVGLIGGTGVLDLGYQSEARRMLILLIGAGVLVCLATMAVAITWFGYGVVPDQSLQEADRNTLSRRAFVLGIFFTTSVFLVSLFAAMATVRNPKLVTRWIRVPRYRRRKRPPVVTVNLPVGFHLNKRSQIIHYVSAIVPPYIRALEAKTQGQPMVSLRLPRGRRPQERNFTPVSDLPTPGGGRTVPRLNRSARVRLVDSAAIDNWNAGKRVEACKLLLHGVLDDLSELMEGVKQRPQWHVYYRLAKFAFLSEQGDWVSQMVQAIEASGVREQFVTAIQSWTDPNSRWRQRLKYVHFNNPSQ